MENKVNTLLEGVDLKQYLPRGYIRMISERIKAANLERPEDDQIASSRFMISKIITESNTKHPIFPFVIEVIVEKSEQDKGFRDKYKANLEKFASIVSE
jgi:hypothetical protein